MLSQGSHVKLMATAASADDARMKLEALETGVSGVLLRTNDPLQVRIPDCHDFQLVHTAVQFLLSYHHNGHNCESYLFVQQGSHIAFRHCRSGSWRRISGNLRSRARNSCGMRWPL